MKKYIPLLFAALLLLSSCVTSAVSSRPNSSSAAGAKLTTYKTYAWYQDQPVAALAYEKEYPATLHQHIRKAVEEELKKKGFMKAAPGSSDADVLVAYDVSVSVPVEKDVPGNFADGFGYSYAYMSGYRYSYGHDALPGYRAVDLYKSGTLILDLIDPENNQLIWRGWTEGALSNFKANYNAVQDEVEKVLAPLPVR